MAAAADADAEALAKIVEGAKAVADKKKTLSDQDLEALYGDLGAMVKTQASGWDFWLLSGNAGVTGALRMRASRRIPINNGGLDCRWLHYQVR